MNGRGEEVYTSSGATYAWKSNKRAYSTHRLTNKNFPLDTEKLILWNAAKEIQDTGYINFVEYELHNIYIGVLGMYSNILRYSNKYTAPSSNACISLPASSSETNNILANEVHIFLTTIPTSFYNWITTYILT